MADKKFKFITTDKKVLHTKSEEVAVDEFGFITNKLTFGFMLCGGAAAGLSAVQLGILKRACIVKLSAGLLVLINPVIIENSGEKAEHIEGCVSIPFKHFNVERYTEIKVEYTKRDGSKSTLFLSGSDARIVQHELDHMDGVIISDIGVETE